MDANNISVGQCSKSFRRRFLRASGAIMAAAAASSANATVQSGTPDQGRSRKVSSERFITKDGTEIFFKDWGKGQPIVFSHGWPLSSDAWDSQMLFLELQGYRVIAHDRRGHGRSQQTAYGNDMDTYADDLATLLDILNLTNVTLVGHSTGGGEVARYVGRHGTHRVSRTVLISSVPPVMLKSDGNPGGVPLSVFDGLRAGVSSNRAEFYRQLAMPFFGFNRPNAKLEQGTIDSFWLQSMNGGVKPHYDCIKQFSETDFTSDLRKIDVPTLVLHGDDDQIVPISDSSMLSAKIIPNAKLVVLPGASHGMCTTNAEKVNSELLSFLKG